MTAAPANWAEIIFDLQRRIKILESSAQMSNTTVGGSEAVPVGDVVAEAAVTNVAMPIVQEDAVDSNDGVSDLSSMFSEFNDDLDARFEDAAADLADAAASLEIANQDITDAFGLQIEGLSDRIDQIVVGAGGTLLLYSDEAPTQQDKAPVGSTWWMVNADENIVGQWQQTGTDDVPVWTPRAIESEIIANLDVGKLTAGQAAIAEVVAMQIAASTANIQTVNVANLFVTQDATMQQATINYLFANVVQAKKITADMLDVNSLNGVTITGAIIKSAATGRRIEIQGQRIDVFGATGLSAASIQGYADSATSSAIELVAVNGGVTARLGVGGVVKYPIINTSQEFAVNSNASHGFTAPVVAATKFLAWNPSTLQGQTIIDGSNLGNIIVQADDVYDRAGNSTIKDSGWLAINTTSGTPDSDNPPQYRKVGRQVYLRGLIAPTSTLQTIGTLPAGYRPGAVIEASCVRTPGSVATATFWDVRIQVGGAIALMGPSGGSGSINLAGFAPYIAEN